MANVLLAWIGRTDLRASTGEPAAGKGPIAEALDSRAYDELVLLSDHGQEMSDRFRAWVAEGRRTEVVIEPAVLRSPTHIGDIYRAARGAVDRCRARHGAKCDLTFHMSPGTPAMAVGWLLLASRVGAALIESSRERGVRSVEVPLDISVELVPDAREDAELTHLSAGLPPDAPEFANILHRSPVMRRVVALARRIAPRNVPVLIEGESGTGKELLARAIHHSSPRGGRPFVAVNCGALAPELADAALFGHVRGAFTGAVRDEEGLFRAASGGTLFLDEIGELPPRLQVKLLRVLQEHEVTPVGASTASRVDARIIAATNRDLAAAVGSGGFREDLFYRLAVGVLRLPPLREREGDLTLLVEETMRAINARNAQVDQAYEPRTLTPGARNVLLAHAWPGNVRELMNTLERAIAWSVKPTISADEVGAMILRVGTARSVLDRALGTGFSLDEVVDEVQRGYIKRALDECDGNRTQAARLIGYKSHQRLAKQMRRLGLARSERR